MKNLACSLVQSEHRKRKIAERKSTCRLALVEEWESDSSDPYHGLPSASSSPRPAPVSRFSPSPPPSFCLLPIQSNPQTETERPSSP